MADAIIRVQDPKQQAVLTSDLVEIGSLLWAMRRISINTIDAPFRSVDDYADNSAALQAMAEKAGRLADRCLSRLGEVCVVGDYDDWTETPNDFCMEAEHG